MNPKNGIPDPYNLEKVSKQHKNLPNLIKSVSCGLVTGLGSCCLYVCLSIQFCIIVCNFYAFFAAASPVCFYVCKALAPKWLCIFYPPSKIMNLLHRSGSRFTVNLSCFSSFGPESIKMTIINKKSCKHSQKSVWPAVRCWKYTTIGQTSFRTYLFR